MRVATYQAAYNALARAAPSVASALQRLTRDTGRGSGRDGAEGAAYFEAVLGDYLTIARESGVATDLFRDKHVLELGPGDTRAIALLTKLEGARSWEGFDPFDIQSRDARYLDAIYEPILARRMALGGAQPARPSLDDAVVHTSPESLKRAGRRFEVIISRAVLEHVRDLNALFEVAESVAREDAVWIHKVDLRSHGITYDHPLDFLRFPAAVWRAMSSHIDLPNRERASRYLALGSLRPIWAATTHVIDRKVADSARRDLAAPFRSMDVGELAVLGLWLVQVGPRHTRWASPPMTLEALSEAPKALSHY